MNEETKVSRYWLINNSKDNWFREVHTDPEFGTSEFLHKEYVPIISGYTGKGQIQVDVFCRKDYVDVAENPRYLISMGVFECEEYGFENAVALEEFLGRIGFEPNEDGSTCLC